MPINDSESVRVLDERLYLSENEIEKIRYHSEEFVEDKIQEFERKEAILRSYRMRISEISYELSERLFKRGFAKQNERVCIDCFKVFENENRQICRCTKCQKKYKKMRSYRLNENKRCQKIK